MSTSNPADLRHAPLLVVGAGIMGTGIAQVAAQAGHAVLLHDTRHGAAAEARSKLAASLQGLVAKGRMAADGAAQILSRIAPIDTSLAACSALRQTGLVVEAIVENLEAKRALFQELEGLVPADCVLATNTSSISVTAIANGLARPERLVGMHFFNPVPLMKLVEVVSGLRTAPAVAQAVFDLAQAWGKTAVHARSTPGFIVNRIARPYYAEALALLLEQAATPSMIDACLRGAGFRMGPCELMDLIGHDTNFAVTSSVYEANFCDKRFQPSLVQREMVDGGLLGRKNGQGFYRYDASGKPLADATAADAAPAQAEAAATLAQGQTVVLHGQGAVADRLAAALTRAGIEVCRDTGQDSHPGHGSHAAKDWTGLAIGRTQLRLTDGRSAAQLAAERAALPDQSGDIAVFDLPLTDQPGAALAWAAAPQASGAWQQAAPQWLAALGFVPQRVADAPGLVVARTIAMLVNEAADAVQQGVCTPEGANAAMKLGVNYPMGPFEWLAGWDLPAVVGLIDALDAHYRGERYRASPWLRQRAWLA